MGFTPKFGAIPSPVDIRDWKIKAPQAANYPETLVLDNLPDVLNQGGVSSCVGHAFAAVIAWHRFRQTGKKQKMSIIGIYGNRRNTSYKNPGMVVREAALAIKKYGDPSYDSLPGNTEVPEAIQIFEENYGELSEEALEAIFTGVARVSEPEDIQHALMNYGPVVFVVKWYKDMKVKNDILDSETKEEGSGSHCMFIYGWTIRDGKNYWLIQNSWGTAWGKHGRALMPFDMPITEAWEIIDEHVDGTTDVVKPRRFVEIFGKAINAILNFIRRFKA